MLEWLKFWVFIGCVKIDGIVGLFFGFLWGCGVIIVGCGNVVVFVVII